MTRPDPTAQESAPFTVEPMRESDIPAVMAIEERSFPSPWPESAFRHELRWGVDSHFCVLQARPEAQARSMRRNPMQRIWQPLGHSPVLGYAGWRFRAGEAHIITLAVHPDWRGRGLGKFLLLTVLEQAVRDGARRVTLEVRTSNRVAQHLYMEVGFVRTGVRPGYYRDGEDAWVMTLGPLDEAGLARLRQLRQAVEVRLIRDTG